MTNIGIIDIESTGLDANRNLIVEVGITKLNLTTGERELIFDSVCHERLRTRELTKKEVEEAWIVTQGYMQVEEIRQAPHFSKIKPEIQRIINGLDGTTAFNKKFDESFLKVRGIKFPNSLPCPMLLATDVCKIKFPSSPKSKRNKWPNVEEAWKHFFPDQPYVEKHRGGDDSFHEAAIVFELFKLGFYG